MKKNRDKNKTYNKNLKSFPQTLELFTFYYKIP